MSLPFNSRPECDPGAQTRAGVAPSCRAEAMPSASRRTQACSAPKRTLSRRSFLALSALGTASLLGASALGSCGGGAPEAETTPSPEPAYVSPYDFTCLVSDERGRLSYRTPEGTVLSRCGIDVSEHQGAIDWAAVAADGIEFAFLRLGYRGATAGALNLDAQFAANLAGALGCGIPTGVYFFSQAVNEAEAAEEAAFALSALGATALSYPLVFDHEPVYGIDNPRANTIEHEVLTACARTFCDAVAAAGYAPMIYGNKRDIARYDREVLTGIPLWFAEYDEPAPTEQFDFSIWQYANSGSVAGISTAVDMNIDLSGALA